MLPPPRAMTMTSTAASPSSERRASTICATVLGPCTAVCRIANRTAGQRFRATETTSRSAAEARPVIRPMVPGRNGMGRLRRESNRPSACSSRRSVSMRASSSPMPMARMSVTRNENVPRPVWKFGFPYMTTFTPSARATGALSTSSRGQTTDSDMSATGSRRAMNATEGRIVSWAISPSTQIRPSLSM